VVKFFFFPQNFSLFLRILPESIKQNRKLNPYIVRELSFSALEAALHFAGVFFT